MTRDIFDMFAPRERSRFGDEESADTSFADPSRTALDDGSVRLDVVLHYDTAAASGSKTGKAVYVSPDGDENRAEWIPHSRCEVERTGRQVSGTTKTGQRVRLDVVRITLPAGLATEKGLL